MDELIVLEDVLNPDGMRRLHLMSNVPIDAEQVRERFGGEWEPTLSREGGVYYLQASWRHSGVMLMACEGWPKPKPMALLPLVKGKRISETVTEAAIMFLGQFGEWPEYAFVRKLPTGIEGGREVDGMLVFEADWMPEFYAGVCGPATFGDDGAGS